MKFFVFLASALFSIHAVAQERVSRNVHECIRFLDDSDVTDLFSCIRDGINQNEHDLNASIKILEEKAKSGDPKYNHLLGLVYFSIPDVKSKTLPNTELSLKHYKLAAAAGYRISQSILGNLYYSGNKVDQSYSTALKWYLMANEKDVGYAMAYRIAEMYEHGVGTSIDLSKAITWYKKAYKAKDDIISAISDHCAFTVNN